MSMPNAEEAAAAMSRSKPAVACGGCASPCEGLTRIGAHTRNQGGVTHLAACRHNHASPRTAAPHAASHEAYLSWGGPFVGDCQLVFAVASVLVNVCARA